MTGVPRHIAEHRLNIREGCLPVRQKKRGQAPERNKAIYEEFKELVDAGIMKEVHYHSCVSQRWLSATRNRLEGRVPLWISIQMFPGRIQRIPSNTNGKRRQGKDNIYHEPKNILLLKDVVRIKNAGANYQRLVDKAFHNQIDWNLEVYVDDLVIKSHTEQEVIKDIEESFKTLREINMKLNPKKCAFGMREGTFLGYKVNADGLRVCPDKVEAVLDLPSPNCLKDVQKLNGKLASLNRFLSKSAEKSLPFFKTLKKCTKKSDFQWIAEAETAFKQMKKSIAELPMLTAPKEKEELIMYLAAAKEAIRSRNQLHSNGKANTCSDKPRTSVKGQILADFIVERPEDDPQDTPIEDKEALPDPWILFTDGSSCIDGSGAGLIITNPKGVEFTYALRFRFDATNNEVEYEALIAGLWIAEQMGVNNLQANVESRLMANQVNGIYIAKKPGMIKYLEKVKTLTNTFKEFSIKQVPRGENKKADALSKVASTSFAHLSKQVLAEELKEKSIDEREVLAANYILREIHEGSCSMHAGPRFVVAKALRSGNGETPFSLTYGTEVMIPVEIGMPTLRTAEVDMIKNNEALEINLDLLEERREQAAIQEAKSKAKMEKYYIVMVHNTSFSPGDLVYRNNEASRAKDGGKLGPKWEGPYEVTKALGKGAYKLRGRDGNTLP
ncbi:reverse transcriptase domain-containing protein [Tanacetum coccineum]